MMSRSARATAVAIAMAATILPARAADLGGGCCADLEERVAELEATTARKGNRVVSLQVYGQVNKALMFLDDGKNSDVYVVDNSQNSSRLGLRGNALIAQGWSAGYVMEFDLNDSPSGLVTLSKDGDEGDNGRGALVLRQNNLYIESEQLGRVTIGRENPASAGAYLVNLGQSNSSSMVSAGGGVVVIPGHMALINVDGHYDSPSTTAVTLDSFAMNFDSSKPVPGGSDVGNLIRYDSPSIYGFVLSASWGDNDYADTAVRFMHDFAGFRVAGAVAYQWNNQFGHLGIYDMNFETLGGSVSVMHLATGVYGTFQAAQRDQKDPAFADPQMWYAQGGIEQKWLPQGATTVYGEYGKYTNAPTFTASEATRVGFGINQKIDAAAMEVYVQATVWSFDDGRTGVAHTEIDDLTTVMVGSRIQF